jgi:rare lipoprotein A
MVVRLGGAICVGAIIFACSSSSASSIGVQKQVIVQPVASGASILGVASVYNPYRKDHRSGGPETASGELYDQTTWTAAIQIDLRERFGGVRFGKD